MGQTTGIAWCDHTFNVVWGCTKVDPACTNCYAEAWAKRTGEAEWGPTAPRRIFGEKHWNEPRRWDRLAEKAGVRRRVFCSSMCDVFDKDMPPGELPKLWPLIRATPHLDWQLLTKRADRIAQSLPPDWREGYPNVWLGVTAGDQNGADLRLPLLQRVPARVRFVSYEPALEDVNWRPHFARAGVHGDGDHPSARIHWLIAGAESGPRARPWKREWWRSARDQCAEYGVTFFLKQEIHDRKKVELPVLDGRQHADFPESACGQGRLL